MRTMNTVFASGLRRLTFATFAAALFAASAPAQDVGGGWSVSNSTGITGLWNSTGTSQVTSATNVTSLSYNLDYHTEQLTVPNYDVTYQGRAGTPRYWLLTLHLTFNNNGWQSYRSSAYVGINVCSYRSLTSSSGTTSLEGPQPRNYFGQPVDNAIWIGSSGMFSGVWVGYTDWTNVNPRAMPLSDFAVDTADTTGKTGVATFTIPDYASVPATYPFAKSPGEVTTQGYVYPKSNYFPAVWLFPRVGQSGSYNLGWPVAGYPIAVHGPDLLDLSSLTNGIR